jgi:hypothetical protein
LASSDSPPALHVHISTLTLRLRPFPQSRSPDRFASVRGSPALHLNVLTSCLSLISTSPPRFSDLHTFTSAPSSDPVPDVPHDAFTSFEPLHLDSALPTHATPSVHFHVLISIPPWASRPQSIRLTWADSPRCLHSDPVFLTHSSRCLQLASFMDASRFTSSLSLTSTHSPHPWTSIPSPRPIHVSI